MTKSERIHGTPTEVYARLAQLFGEEESEGTRWVTIGAGGIVLTFFPERKTA